MRAPLHPLRAISRLFSFRRSDASASLCDDVISILETSAPLALVPSLDRLAPRLTLASVQSVFLRLPHPSLKFRFFIWALRLKHIHCWKCYDLAVDALLTHQSFHLYWSILEEHKSLGVSIDSDAFALLVTAYSALGDAEKAVEAFGRMRDFGCDPNVHTYNKILHVIVRKDFLLLALAVYNKMSKSNCLPNIATYAILIDGFRRSGKMMEALKLFDDMTTRGIIPNQITTTLLISLLSRARNTSYAYDLFESMRRSGFTPDNITFNALLDGFCKSGKVGNVLLLLPEFKRNGYVLGLKGYSSIIDGLFRLRRDDEAELLYKKMIKTGIEPDIVLYGIMVRGFSRAARFGDAMGVIKEMTQKGVPPNTHCYNALIKGFCDAGLLEKAQSLQHEISQSSDSPPSAYTYTILICGMCRNGLVTEAQKIFSKMENIGCLPSIVSFNALMDGLCKAGELKEARLLLTKMNIGRHPSIFLQLYQGPNHVPKSLIRKVDEYCESGLFLEAYRLIMRLANYGVLPDIKTYNTLINGFSKAGNIKAAIKLFDMMTENGLSPDSVTYGTLINGLLMAERDEDAFKYFHRMEHSGCTPGSNVYKTLMTWSSRKGKVAVTFSLWLKYLKGVPGFDKEVMRSVELKFERREVIKAVKQLLEIDLNLSDFDAAFYTIFQFGLCQAGKTEDALSIFGILRDHQVSVSPPSCVKLIDCLLREGNLQSSVDVFLYTLEKGFKMRPQICNRLLQVLLQSPYWRKVVDLIERMRTSGYNLDEHLYDVTKNLLFSTIGPTELEEVLTG